jgi:hypothetical protein
MSTDATASNHDSSDDQLEDAIVAIRHALQGLRYGHVVAIVQDGMVIQVDRTERRRLRPPTPRLRTRSRS